VRFGAATSERNLGGADENVADHLKVASGQWSVVSGQ
jgi:hypothetical protein